MVLVHFSRIISFFPITKQSYSSSSRFPPGRGEGVRDPPMDLSLSKNLYRGKFLPYFLHGKKGVINLDH